MLFSARSIIALSAVVATVGLVVFFLTRPEPEPVPDAAVLPEGTDSASSVPSEASGMTADISPVRPSIEELVDKDFDGRDFSVGQILERYDAYTRYYITYRSGELSISGIMNVPSGDGPFPVLILNHGYIDPAIYTNGRGLRREQDYLARQGFVVIHPDYRNHAQSSRVDDGDLENRLGYVEDVINAVYAVRASSLPYFDKENIGMLGHSMGGGVAQTIAVAQPDLVKSIALYAPISMDYRDSYFKYMANDPERADRIRERYGAPDENAPVWVALSPATYVERISVPMILFQGTRDESVPKEWSDKTAELMKTEGKPLDYVVYDGEAHEFGPRWTDFMRQTTEFFRQHLAS